MVAASTDPIDKAREVKETAATLGAIGRLVWQDVLGLVQHYKKQT